MAVSLISREVDTVGITVMLHDDAQRAAAEVHG